MEKSGRRFFSFSSPKQDSMVMHRLSPDFDLSRASSYTNHSISTNHSKIRTTASFSTTARGVAGAFITCFVPECNRGGGKAPPKIAIVQADDNSIASTSRILTVSSSSQSKFEYSGSNHAQQQTPEFSIEEIYKATGKFATENIIGQGGFGTVYKGKLKNGSLVAVKRAKKNTFDMHLSVEFKNEVQTLSKVEHLNLVRFLGYLDDDDERIIVVEYVGNGTLREHLDGTRGDGLEIAERLDIAIDVAHAVAYLHMYTDHPIIHRDIKASNVLLTESLRAKVANFGFARLAAEDPEATHVSTQVKGTAGYMDPEYLRTYQLTEKSDVYSFGVLLVEIVTGRRPIENHRDRRDRRTTRWAMQLYTAGDAVIAMDARLRRTPASVMAVEKMMGLAAECLKASRRSRPSMNKCAELLWGIRRDLLLLSNNNASARPAPANKDKPSLDLQLHDDDRTAESSR